MRLRYPPGRYSINSRARYTSTQVTITDPLVLYQSHVERGLLMPDEAQFRAAVE
jgi:hypothetical protein